MPTASHDVAGPSGLKPLLARTGTPYRWARRARALTRYWLRRPHDPDFAAFGVLRGDGLFLDVGASIGQSALSFRIFNREAPILSLEPLPSHRDDLRLVGRVARRHRFMIAGAAERSSRAVLYVPMLGSYALSAEASLDRDSAAAVLERLRTEGAVPKKLRLEEVSVELRRIDELGLSPSFVKIDVEGSELGVLRGMLETLRRSGPALMVERSERVDGVVALLEQEGYRPFVFDRAAAGFEPYEGQPVLNVFFLPAG